MAANDLLVRTIVMTEYSYSYSNEYWKNSNIRIVEYSRRVPYSNIFDKRPYSNTCGYSKPVLDIRTLFETTKKTASSKLNSNDVSDVNPHDGRKEDIRGFACSVSPYTIAKRLFSHCPTT